MQLAGRADWALMTAVHGALRRDLDELLHGTASHVSARARWDTLSSQLRSHLAADHAAMWPGSGPSASGHLMPAVTTMEVSHDVRACRTNGFRRRPRLVVTAGG